LGAVGIGGAGFGSAKATMASYHGSDLQDVARELGRATGDVKILSVHFGQEMQVRPSAADEKRLRDAVERNDIDMLAGHHAHVAAGVQMVDGRVIFYGLGNLMHPGMRDMAGQGVCRDFGVLAKVHFGRRDGTRYRVRAIEMRSLVDMHGPVRVRTGDDAARRLAVINHHARSLDDTAAVGVRFKMESSGVGLHCTASALDQDDDVAARCRAVAMYDAPAPDRQIVASCGGEPSVADRRMPKVIKVEARAIPDTRANLTSVRALPNNDR
jgi:poly-gamma-glutamate synthesis protein (capsule biosynthesis protein)